MTTESDRIMAEEAGLDALFAAVRAAEPPVPDALLARVLADAAAHVPRAVRRPAPRRRSWFAGVLDMLDMLDMLGGRGAMAGLAAAGMAGVFIGFVQPVDLGFALTTTATDAEAVDLYPADIDQWADLVAPETVPEG